MITPANSQRGKSGGSQGPVYGVGSMQVRQVQKTVFGVVDGLGR